MSPTEYDAEESGPYADAIGQLMAAAERTREPDAWLTLTALAEMFVRLDQRHRAKGPAGHVGLDSFSAPPEADKPS